MVRSAKQPEILDAEGFDHDSFSPLICSLPPLVDHFHARLKVMDDALDGTPAVPRMKEELETGWGDRRSPLRTRAGR